MTVREDADLGDVDTWDWLTVMEGPDVSGQEQIRFGRVTEPIEEFTDDGDIRLCAEPKKEIPLPRPMTRSEIDDWLTYGGWWRRYIELFTDSTPDVEGEAVASDSPNSTGSKGSGPAEEVAEMPRYCCTEDGCTSPFTVAELEDHLEADHGYTESQAVRRIWRVVEI